MSALYAAPEPEPAGARDPLVLEAAIRAASKRDAEGYAELAAIALARAAALADDPHPLMLVLHVLVRTTGRPAWARRMAEVALSRQEALSFLRWAARAAASEARWRPDGKGV